MCHFWQAGAETLENVTFGELAAPPESRRSTTSSSGAYRLLRAFIITFEVMHGFPGEIEHDTDNLYNNNIYI